MRTLKEIQEGLDIAIREATAGFIKTRIETSEQSRKNGTDTYSLVKKATVEAAYNYYRNKITEVEKDMYFINRPKLEIEIDGSIVNVRGTL